MIRSIQWRRAIAAASIIGATALSCTEFVHTNPFDPVYTLKMTIVGPDTLTSLNQNFTLSVVLDPPWPDAPLDWGFPDADNPSQSSDHFHVLGNGNYRTKYMPQETVEVEVAAGPHRAVKQIVLNLRTRQVEWIPCPTGCIASLEVGSRFVTAYKRDSLGYRADDATIPGDLAQFTVSRNPGVATVASVQRFSNLLMLTFNGHTQGSTYLVFTKHISDSVRVWVDYRPTTLSLTCPTSMTVGSTAQLTAAPKGPAGQAILAPFNPTWSVSGGASISQSGVVTANNTGTQIVTASVAYFDGQANWMATGTCNIQVTS